jgi:uncharacterized membrane protein YGL010W
MFRTSLFRPALELLVQYARHHRDQRNIATHLVGVPLIVFAAGVLLARGGVELAGMKTSLAWLAFAVLALWMLTRGLPALALATAAFVGALVWAAHGLGSSALVIWLAWGFGLFALGWTIQLVGHYYEGRRPASTEDPVALIVAPMFVVLEFLAMAGFCRPLVARIEHQAGPTMLRDLAQPLPR